MWVVVQKCERSHSIDFTTNETLHEFARGSFRNRAIEYECCVLYIVVILVDCVVNRDCHGYRNTRG